MKNRKSRTIRDIVYYKGFSKIYCKTEEKSDIETTWPIRRIIGESNHFPDLDNSIISAINDAFDNRKFR